MGGSLGKNGAKGIGEGVAVGDGPGSNRAKTSVAGGAGVDIGESEAPLGVGLLAGVPH